jgi:hypothetical protein
MATKTPKTVTIAAFAELTARLALVEERLAELQSAPAAKKTKKAKAAPAEGEEKVLSPWLTFCARITALLKEEENADAKTAVWPARLTFCGHLKTVCEGEYDTLTDDAILEHALSFVAPEKVAKAKKPAAEEPAPKTPKKAAKPTEVPPAPKKKAVKKAVPAAVPAPNPFADEEEAEGDF